MSFIPSLPAIKSKKTYTYRVCSGKGNAEIEHQLNKASQEGFMPYCHYLRQPSTWAKSLTIPNNEHDIEFVMVFWREDEQT